MRSNRISYHLKFNNLWHRHKEIKTLEIYLEGQRPILRVNQNQSKTKATIIQI